MDYYKEQHLIELVDRQNRSIGSIDKWQAHKQGLLHRGFTLCLYYQDKIILQHRKHPVFDDVYDLACSSHPIYKKGALQDTKTAVYEALVREWNVQEKHLLVQPSYKGVIYYKAKDTRSSYIEHEMCELYIAHIKNLPSPSLYFSYGFSVMELSYVKDKTKKIHTLFAPWVTKLIDIL